MQGPWDGSLQSDALVPRPRWGRWLGLPVGLWVELVHLHLELRQSIMRCAHCKALGRAWGALSRVRDLMRDTLKTTQLGAWYSLHH